MSDNTSEPKKPENNNSKPLTNDDKTSVVRQENYRPTLIALFVVLAFIVGFLADLLSIVPNQKVVCSLLNVPMLCSSDPCVNMNESSANCAISLFANKEMDPNIPPQLRIETLLEKQDGVLQSTTDFRVDDRMKIRFKSNHDGYVFLFNITPDGELMTFFPNQYSETQQAYLKAGKELIIPDIFWEFDFPVKEPTGRSTLVAVLVKDEEEDELAIGYNVLPLVSKKVSATHAKHLLQILHLQLEAMTVDDEQADNRPVQWFSNVANYEIMH
ncbi:DUF4384 domain-containing protein [Candidatus Parabeggiatoa sp. HSG14]|uniref:DUF4384 domain-containing protein n=1 Tax=Candidatus Parabeggiatoa sp. HSG14 TaxID=3055593 RepID=UPI0025A83234|nr:DUF4384 domain-containing protein [Thiotrichales bacterium HSG14]